MTEKLFIPTKIKVGFNHREDTYTKKLGYVIPLDGKKYRKETGWNNWREHYITPEEFEIRKRKDYDSTIAQQTEYYHSMKESLEKSPSSYSADHWYRKETNNTLDEFLKKNVGDYEEYSPRLGSVSCDEGIIPQEFDNVPTEGFVLNKKVGGYSTGWNHRATYCRVHDPRGFEFEIQLPNLLFILKECNCMKGKGLEGSFVYSWDGAELILLPTSCEDYVKSGKYNEMQKGKVSTKELVEGCYYKEKSMTDLVYIGKFNWFANRYLYNYNNKTREFFTAQKAFIFYDPKNKRFSDYSGMTNFIQKVTDTPDENYATYLDEFNKSSHSGNLEGVYLTDYILPTEWKKGYRDNNLVELGQVVLELGDNKYSVYDLKGELDPNSGYSTYSYDRAYKFNNFTAIGKKTVVLKDGGEFDVKAAKPTDITGTPKDLVQFKQLTITRGKDTKPIMFF